MRQVARNRPFIVPGGARDWTACKLWNASYLVEMMGDQCVNVAITPHGNADSIVSLPGKAALFVKPYERAEPFSTVLRSIQRQELHKDQDQDQDQDQDSAVRYAQTQNDNLRNEYAALFDHVPKSIPFARIALHKEPDAINFWLGNSASVTALHKDHYENIYVQILGQKHFTLLPPVEAPCVAEKSMLAATYTTQAPDGRVGKKELCICIDEPRDYVPCATWDPDVPAENGTPLTPYSRPMRVTLNQGDMLYLPALWYHKVTQSCNEEGICCAVNYWYDMDLEGGAWAAANFVRNIGLMESGREREHGA